MITDNLQNVTMGYVTATNSNILHHIILLSKMRLSDLDVVGLGFNAIDPGSNSWILLQAKAALVSDMGVCIQRNIGNGVAFTYQKEVF